MINITKVTDGEVSFGTTKCLRMRPPIPVGREDLAKFKEIAQGLFSNGGTLISCGLFPIDKGWSKENWNEASRLVRAHLTSWEPKHQDKIHGVAVMMSTMFTTNRKLEHV